MVNYEYWYKLFDTALVNRRAKTSPSKDKSVPKSNVTKQQSTANKAKPDKTKESNSVNGKSSNLTNVASPRSIVTFIANFLTICAVSGLLITLFYVVPWEQWVFSEDELERLQSGEDLEYRNFLATADQQFDEISIHEVPCYEKAYWREKRLNVLPERCGVMVTDDLLPNDQILKLRSLATKVIDKVGDTSYANRESINLQWINLHNLYKRNATKRVLRDVEFDLIRNASLAAREAVSTAFGLPTERLFFNMVSQFTRYRPLVKHNEFRHVDKVRSPALIVTSILWLSTANLDFGGGHTEFLNGPGPEPYSPVLIEPKMGRFAAWTSGFENPHEVTELFWGNRLALIFAFTVSDKLGYESMEALRDWATNGTSQITNSSY
ncbi:2-oxoglutarate and iron-dependent oxygenase domain-containing protein 3 [Tetranychus urticae]|uniref:Prolyl 4-hydroxylase alpha subunit domain-containing protein n=1 Tax=Tetranychus urticae TaxID=32264 RepID=T1JWJ9_TETUR|nr:2-oxoglutarate and iron-dependent oxygenase domain-containing protein 3 [Tetranychus urticae]